MYRSELAALSTKSRIAAFRIDGRTPMPNNRTATTKGEAAAEVAFELATKRSRLLDGTKRVMQNVPEDVSV